MLSVALWLPPMRLCAPQSQPAADDIRRFAVDASRNAQPCEYSGSIDDVPPLWFVNRSEKTIGHGRDAYLRASAALGDLQCLELDWLTHRVHDDALAICSRQFGVVWLMNANKFIRSRDVRGGRRSSVAWATTRRHVLCGEEQLTVRWDEANDDVSFEVLSFSRPRHLFSWVAYPYVVLQQKRFARDATAVMRMRASCER